MAKRLQDTQLTKDHDYDAPEDTGGPDSQPDPSALASAEAMKKRTIKQPKSRFQVGPTTPRTSIPQSSFSFGNDATSTTPATPAPTANGNSLAPSFGGTPATPAPKSAFAGFPTLNGGTPATPSQEPQMKSTNPFALLNSTTPAGKPPAGIFGTTTPFGSTTPAGMPGMPATPAGQPTFDGSTIKFLAREETKGQASDSPLAKPTFGGVSEFKFPTLAAKKDEAGEAAKPKPTFGGVSEFNFPTLAAKKDEAGEAAKPKPTFGGVSEFNFPMAAKKDEAGEAAKPKLTFGGVSEFNFPTLANKKDEAGEAAKPKPTFGGVSTFSFPEPVAKNDGETRKPTFGGVSTFNISEPVAKNSSDAGKPQSTFGGVPTSGIFAQKDKVTEEKPANPFAGMFGPKGAITQAAAPTKPSAASAPAPVSGALFGNLSSTASAGLFGSEAKIGETKKVDGGIFGSSTSGASAPATGNKHEESSKPVSRGIFGVKTPISLNASSTTGEVSYPALPPTSTASTAPPVTTNGNTALTQLNQVPQPCEDLTEAQREEFDWQYKVRTLNFTFVRALQDIDVNSADLRVVFREYERLYEHIMHGTKRKDESQENGTALSPKRSKTEEQKPAASSAASVFGAIVDKNIRQPAASTAKEDQLKSVFGGFNSQLKNTPTPEKPTVTSSTFGNSFATSPMATNADSTKQPKATSMLFGAGGGAAVSATAHSSGGLFSNLKPILRDQKDRGEEDSPEKPKSGELLFGAKPTDGPSVFSFQTASTPEKPSSGFTFGTPRAEGDQTWKPDTPIKFGGSSSEIFGSQSSTNTAPSQTLNFNSQETAASTAPSDASKPPFSFTSNNSLARPFVSQNASFDGITSSGISTPRAINDTSAPASATSTEVTKFTEPSDEVHADKIDMSGPGPGEENDEVLYSVRVAVYIKDDHGAMKKVAVGVSRVLKDKDTMKTRFLVRTEQGKVVVNVRLQEGVHYTPVPDKKVILIPDFSSGQKPKVYTVRMKESSAVVELGRIIAEVKG